MGESDNETHLVELRSQHGREHPSDELQSTVGQWSPDQRYERKKELLLRWRLHHRSGVQYSHPTEEPGPSIGLQDTELHVISSNFRCHDEPKEATQG